MQADATLWLGCTQALPTHSSAVHRQFEAGSQKVIDVVWPGPLQVGASEVLFAETRQVLFVEQDQYVS